MHTRDFIQGARADGFEFAERVRENSELVDALERFMKHDGPAFLEVCVDPDALVMPMVGPGQSYKDMVVGDWIRPRNNIASSDMDGATQADLF